jgi:hypothetical protein
MKTWIWTSGYSFWKATTIGASSESEMLGALDLDIETRVAALEQAAELSKSPGNR